MTARRTYGGSLPLTGFAVHHAGAAQSIGNSGTWKPDTLDFASADWVVDLANGTFAPQSEAGLYIVSCEIRFEVDSGGPADEVWADIQVSQTAWNVDPIEFNFVPVDNSIGAGIWRGICSTVIPLGPGGQLSVVVLRHPYSAMTTTCLANSYLRAFKIGDDASLG